MSAPDWRQLARRFVPTERLSDRDADLYVERPGAAARAIAAELAFDPQQPTRWVMCGSVGSGKSSELVHLGMALRRDFFVVGLDLALSVADLELTQPAEVIFLIGAAAIRAGRDRLGPGFGRNAEGQLLTRFRGLFEPGRLDVDLGEVIRGVTLFVTNLAAPGLGSVIGAADGAAQVAAAATRGVVQRHQSRGRLGGLTRPLRDGDPDLEGLIETTDTILDEIRREDRAPVVLVDGLDKLLDNATIRRLFTASGILARPASTVLYTAPITLMLSTEWARAGQYFRRQRLFNVLVHQPPGGGHEVPAEKVAQGVATLKQMVSLRLAREHLNIDDVFSDGVLEPMIIRSGGLLRDLLQLLDRAIRAAFVAGSGRIGPAELDKATRELSYEYAVTMTTRMQEELQHVREHGMPSGRDDISLELLKANYVLPYENGEPWFALNPLVEGLRSLG